MHDRCGLVPADDTDLEVESSPVLFRRTTLTHPLPVPTTQLTTGIATPSTDSAPSKHVASTRTAGGPQGVAIQVLVDLGV